MIDEVRAAFAALSAREMPSGSDLNLLALQASPMTSVGVDHDGRQHLLINATKVPISASGVPALDLKWRTLTIGGSSVNYLDVICLAPGVVEVFDHFVVSVIEELVASREQPARVVSRVIGRWQNFFRTGGHKPPSVEKLSALFGELSLVDEMIKTSGSTDISCWVGPFGARHDLRRASTACEVKTTRAHTSRHVTIHGEDQLVSPEGGCLYLYFIRLELVPDGTDSVASRVDSLLAAGVSAEALFGAISAGGVAMSDLAETSKVTFDVAERRFYRVDENFPRITQESFVGSSKPTGVVSLTYVVDLDHCADNQLNDRESHDVIAKLMGGDSNGSTPEVF